ncbi:MAG: glycosyltransferase family 2 protein [Verrucomicrobiales bacterium]
MQLSIVFPCLNEAASLGQCLDEAKDAVRAAGITEVEIIVADNGSDDGSRQIAEGAGVRVIDVRERGYGTALRKGIGEARGNYVAFADCDGTYGCHDLVRLFQTAIEHDADLTIGTRLGKPDRIAPGAMPAMHRHLGTPVLTWLIRFLFSGKMEARSCGKRGVGTERRCLRISADGYRSVPTKRPLIWETAFGNGSNGTVSDCNCGARCVRMEAYESWCLRSNGMEFASEMLIEALRQGSRIVEIPISLRKAADGRIAHLHTWRDGMRHLLFILAQEPRVFERSGLAIMATASMGQVAAWALGPITIAQIEFLHWHSQLLLMMAAVLGAHGYFIGLALFSRESRNLESGTRAKRSKALRVSRQLIDLREDRLLRAAFLTTGAAVGTLAWLVAIWSGAGFHGISEMQSLLGIVHFLLVAGTLLTGLLGVHLLKQ